MRELLRQEEETGFKEQGATTFMGPGRQNRVAYDEPISTNYHINNPKQAGERMRNSSPGISNKEPFIIYCWGGDGDLYGVLVFHQNHLRGKPIWGRVSISQQNIHDIFILPFSKRAKNDILNCLLIL